MCYLEWSRVMKSDDYLAISGADDKEGLRSALCDFADKMGFGLVTALLVDGDLDSPQLKIGSVGNTPSDFLQGHHDVDAIRMDPVLRRLIGPTTPFSYSQQFYVDAGAGHLWEEQAPHGYRYGLAASLPIGPSRHVLVGVDRPDPLPVDQDALTRMYADLQLLAMHAHSAAVRLLDAPVPDLDVLGLPKLTQRELQVLMWAAQGKSVTVTAQILGLSHYTVRNYLSSVLEKMNVSSKLQAVQLATALGII